MRRTGLKSVDGEGGMGGGEFYGNMRPGGVGGAGMEGGEWGGGGEDFANKRRRMGANGPMGM